MVAAILAARSANAASVHPSLTKQLIDLPIQWSDWMNDSFFSRSRPWPIVPETGPWTEAFLRCSHFLW